MAPSRVVLACALCMAVAGSAAAQGWTSGVATFAGDNPNAGTVPNGACGFGPVSISGARSGVAGISQSKSALASGTLKGCGQCVEIRCTDKQACSTTNTVVAVITDDCEKCTGSQINLSANIFAELAPLDLGRIAVEYKAVPCSFDGGVTARVDEIRTSDGGWVRLVFKTVNGAPLDKVELSKAGENSFKPMRNVFGAAWEASRLPALPWDIRLTNAAGKSLVLPEAVTVSAKGDYKTSKNF